MTTKPAIDEGMKAAFPTKLSEKFRKKPVVIEAWQWHGHGATEGEIVRYYRRPDDDGGRQCEGCSFIMNNHGWIDTLEGGHIVCPRDWIITGVRGEIYACKPGIFDETYEPA